MVMQERSGLAWSDSFMAWSGTAVKARMVRRGWEWNGRNGPVRSEKVSRGKARQERLGSDRKGKLG